MAAKDLPEGREVMMNPKALIPIESDGKLNCVEKFCYLSDIIRAGGGARDASITRVRCAWNKFRELSKTLTTRGASLGIKGKV